MAKHRTLRTDAEHPPWCKYRDPNKHDPHLSARERVGADFPSDLIIKAYLLRTRTPVEPHPEAPLVALEFHFPGEETASVLMTFRQLRRLEQALCRLIRLGERSSPN